jgi:hypothetical protein
MTTRIGLLAAAAGAVLALLAGGGAPASASSNFRLGQSSATDPISGEAQTVAVCSLFLGPRGDVPAGQFLLEITDLGPETPSDALQLRGQVITEADGSVRLFADDTAAQDFYEQILAKRLHVTSTEFDLHRLLAHVAKTAADIGESTITCGVRMVGFLNPTPDPRHPTGKRHSDGPVSLIFGGEGLMFEGIPEAPPGQQPALTRAAATEGTAGLSRPAAECPTPTFPPSAGPNLCNTPDCLVTFKGYKWWTNYNYFNPGSGYWNANNRWSPRNVEPKEDGLHLSVRQQLVPDKDGTLRMFWSSGEAVTALNLDNSLAKLGYGTYLVSAKVLTASSWNAMDPNVAFGVFTYERDGTGDTNNPNRELDLAEVSRWGRRDNEACRIQPPGLCEGNSQYTLQVWWAGRDDAKHQLPNVTRYTIPESQNDITLVMIWEAANKPVTFRQYNGRYTLATLPKDEEKAWNFEWITPPGGGNAGDRNPWVPGDGCQQFHLNFWQGNNTDPKPEPGINPPPANPQEIVVTEFEYKPLGP